MGRRFLLLVAATLVLTLVCLLGYSWRRNEPKRRFVQALQVFRAALDSPDSERLLKLVAAPQVVQGKTPQEQAEFIRKALKNEISEDGLRVIASQGSFGPLSQIFPVKGLVWARQAGVNPNDCVALKCEHNGPIAEVVMEVRGETYRVVRCNNVKQLARERPRT
jgi:hypothetical protein